MDVMFCATGSRHCCKVSFLYAYLVEGGKGFAERMGEAAWKTAENIWGSIRINLVIGG